MSRIWVGFAFALSAQLALHASQTQPSNQQQANAPATTTVTVTGCVQPGTAVATGSPTTGPDAPTASPGPAHFVLMQPSTASGASDSPVASAAPGGSGGATAPAAAVGTSGSMARASHYILYGRDGELAKHVGQRVEIVGSSSQAAPADTGAAAAAAGAGTQVIPHEPQRGTISTLPAGSDAGAAGGAEATAHPSVQHLLVQSVRRVAGTCS